MALYEIVLRRPERDDEVRFTDREPTPGSLLNIDFRAFRVGSAERSSHDVARMRFVCVIDDEDQRPQPGGVD